LALTYNPGIFSVRNHDEAKRIILTPEGSSTEQRWEAETPIVADLAARHNSLGGASVVLDYGCGIGRIAKELIARHGCNVVGVDISPSMRALSVEYVNSDNFFACSPTSLNVLIASGLRFDLAVSIWVLQHCLKPAEDIGILRGAIKPGGGLLVMNNLHRAVPTMEKGWANDGIDIRKTLSNTFALQAEETLVSPLVPAALSGVTFWASYKNGTG
jgi:2-polyprenyl-3-methyl-5-hydroxy-6-metoxy-1,4-benzoquinol methylase